MKRMSALLGVVLLLLVALSLPALAGNDGKPVLAVKTFENPPNYANSTVGTGLTDMFITELMKTGKYRIIERAQMGTLTDEIDFGKSGYVEQKSAVKKGNIKGVQYYFLAKVTNFGAENKKVGAGGFGGSVFGGLGFKKDKANVRIDFRIVDATSGETIYADFGEGNYSKSGISFGGGAWGHGGGSLDLSSSEFLESMVGKATILAMNNIIDKMDHSFLSTHTSRAAELAQEEANAQNEAVSALRKVPGKVLARIKDTIIVNLGSSNGVKVGDRISVCKTVDTRNSKGEVVYSEEQEVGSIEVYEVQPDRCKCHVVNGSAGEGDVAKLAQP